jgi:cell division protein FtsI (penicillin-binding protein 3)
LDARAELAINRIKVLVRICFVWGVLIMARLIYLQIVKHDEYVRQAQLQQQRDVEVQAPRGTIFDRTGEPLAMSVPVDSVCVNPLRFPDPALAATLFARSLDMDAADLEAKIQTAQASRRGFLWIKRKITPEESARLRHFRLDWIEFRQESKRDYPSGQTGSHVVGSVDHEEKGNNGLELALNKELQGKPGYVRTTSDVKQRVVDLKVMGDPQPGKNITLSIDKRIQ